MTRFQKYLSISLAIHIIIIALLWVNPAFNFGPEKKYKVTWLKLSRGDGGTSKKASLKNTKNLPQSTLREQKQALKELAKDKDGSDLKSKVSETKKTAPQKESQKRTSDTGGINVNKTPVKKPTNDAIVNDALARIDQQLKQREVDLSAAQTKTNETGQSQWGSDEGSDIDPALVMYYNTIKRKIIKEWSLSKSEFTQPLRAKIDVIIDPNGNIVRSTLNSSSGDGSFDDSALRAVKNSSPFPPPPDSIKSEIIHEGFTFEFTPGTVMGHI